MVGHEKYAGKLAIPYLTKAGAVSLRFRAIPDKNPDWVPPRDPLDETVFTGHLPEVDEAIDNPEWLPIEGPKYLSLPGDPPRIFNPADNERHEDFAVITEGEFDCITAHQDGLPGMGVPGVSSWQPWMRWLFTGYRIVYILADNDDKGQGQKFGNTVASALKELNIDVRVILMPQGHDVNSWYVANGQGSVKQLIEGVK